MLNIEISMTAALISKMHYQGHAIYVIACASVSVILHGVHPYRHPNHSIPYSVADPGFLERGFIGSLC